MKNILRCLAVSLLALPVAGCPGKLDFGTFNFSDVSYVGVSGTLESSDGVAAIKEFRLVLDGATLQDTILSAPAVRLNVSGTKYGSGDGDHRLSLVIVDQTTTPNQYVVNGITVVHHVPGSVNRTLTLEPRTAQLQIGDSISYTFKF